MQNHARYFSIRFTSQRAILAALSLLLLNCAHKAPEPEITEDYALWLDARDEVHFHGRIYKASVNAIQTLYTKSKRKPEIIHITSGGGDLRAGLELGKWVHNIGIGIHVDELCASTCANYVFLGAHKKYLDKSAVLIWHGGARQANLLANFESSLDRKYQQSDHEASIRQNDGTQARPSKTCEWDESTVKRLERSKQKPYIISEVRSCIDELIAEEIAFFKLIGVDPELPYYGQLGEYKALYESKNHRGFDFNLRDLKAMGVDNIYLTEKQWNPEESDLRSKGNIYRIAFD